MTTYSHQKSLRHVTDEQFSDGTTVDGNRIDRSLQDAVDHVNNIPRSDVTSRFTDTKFVFGYRPSRSFGSDAARANDDPGCLTGTAGAYYYAHHFPWMPIANNVYLQTGDTQAPQNPFVVKGVALDDPGRIQNTGLIPRVVGGGTNDWADDLAAYIASGAQGTNDYTTAHGPANGYQYAWTNSWKIHNESVIDDLMIALTIDGRTNLGSPDSGFPTDAKAEFHGAGAATNGTSTVSVVLMVDNHFSQELRADSEIEIAAHRYNLNGFRYTMTPFSGGHVTDMLPALNTSSIAAQGQGLSESVIMRWRDLNIPLHKDARLRLSITLPWTKDNSNPDGLTWDNGGTEVATAPFYYFSPRGCMTLLEEVVG